MVTIPDYSSWLKSRKAKPFKSNTSFFNIPIFNENIPNFNSNTLVSVIATQFNYQATQHFVIKSLPTKPSAPTFCPVIKYIRNNVVTRYKLWDNVGEEVIPANLYNGEKIFKNFTIEIWTIPVSDPVTNPLLNIVNVTVLPIGISILSYVTDLAKKDVPVEDCVGVECNTLNNINAALPLTNIQNRYESDMGVTANVGLVSLWRDQSGNNRDLGQQGGSPVFAIFDPAVNNKPTITFTAFLELLQNISLVQYKINHIFILLKKISWTNGKSVLVTDALTVSQASFTPTLRATLAATNVNNSNLVLGDWGILEISIDPNNPIGATTLNTLYSRFGYIEGLFNAIIGSIQNDSTLNFVLGDANISLVAVIGYRDKLASSIPVYQYLNYKFNNGFTLPLAFQPCTTGNLN